MRDTGPTQPAREIARRIDPCRGIPTLAARRVAGGDRSPRALHAELSCARRLGTRRVGRARRGARGPPARPRGHEGPRFPAVPVPRRTVRLGQGLCSRVRAGTPKVENPPERDTAPKACRQRTIGIPGDVMPKIRQRHSWGSDAWIAAYIRRSRVEGAFGTLKSSKTENVRRGWTHVVGLVKTGIMVVIAQAAANLRCLQAWAARTGDRTDSPHASRPRGPRLRGDRPGRRPSGEHRAASSRLSARTSASHQPTRRRVTRIGALRVDPSPEPSRSPAAHPSTAGRAATPRRRCHDLWPEGPWAAPAGRIVPSRSSVS